jgi:recombination protein RecA
MPTRATARAHPNTTDIADIAFPGWDSPGDSPVPGWGSGGPVAPETTCFAARLPRGRLIEITAGHPTSAQTTATVACLLHAQARGETTAWIQPEGGALYPPDLADAGVDLDALVVVHVPTGAGPHGGMKAAEILLRSGGFGMVVVDLGRSPALPAERAHGHMLAPRARGLERTAWQSRLFALAREHGSWLILLTPENAQLGSLISLRVEPRRTRVGHGRFAIEHVVRKDKSGACASFTVEYHRGPCGLV